ncbi:ChrR family anti-sigma-E factor [Mesorhizobium qingshengii]|uniref:Anti-ECFsigma factor, ChrR n=1 Tax=Mesorhizobium qingshengii TaxID=1165689 RepID=A0A1G5ZT65_9HYPH|nr:ChrR family anti-sigma-E factor [Mesorhizobium qingshengii]SDA97812.1 anti-ECFsigma factor, ChrR [Mesorhizobium qingshengii]
MMKHHPSDETLFRFASGSLESGPRIVVAVHVGGCTACAARISEFEAVGGALLNGIEPEEMGEDALDRLMARIEVDSDSGGEAAQRSRPTRADVGIRLPEALDGCGIGPWRWIGPGVRWSRVTIPEDASANVMLLKVAAGRRLPEHTHSGCEYTQVLKGSFYDARGRYGPGDLDEADDEIQHQPVVDETGECICLAALEGRMRLRGFFGRLVQPFIGG